YAHPGLVRSPSGGAGLSRPSSRLSGAGRLSGAARAQVRSDGREVSTPGARPSQRPWGDLFADSVKRDAQMQAGPYRNSMKRSTYGAGDPSPPFQQQDVLPQDVSQWLVETIGAGKLGAVQRDGRTDALQQWVQQWQQQLLQRKLHHKKIALETSLNVRPARVRGVDAPKQEWCKLNGKSRRAIQQWASGQIGGRHCLMLLEHDTAISFFISPLDHLEVSASDVGGSIGLCALSGLSAEAEGSREGGWLYSEVFSKTPDRVLEEALKATVEDVADPLHERNGGLSADQVNLSLRRLAMNAQSVGMRSLLGGGVRQLDGPRCSEEYIRVQVWLELVRMHLQEAAKAADSASGPRMRQSKTAARTPSKERPQQKVADDRPWDDQLIVCELAKPDAELEAEARDMSMEALCRKNLAMEFHLMRLVRQRDHLKNMALLTEQCGSYLVLGLEGPEATEEEVKKAYRDLARKTHPDKVGTEHKDRFQEIQR
ncbi:unnamed protein product, partial [Polarella glacialis]